ncbi:unnamed protein product [Strongylus vulgaris]|uniref:Uncharacterized protein n=1 Tax=Strongylus vulgaris TaxID=40348 RepID=A0A3P7IFH1_STRVU|nr:unnamed protein product [Strongylus vulgaris]
MESITKRFYTNLFRSSTPVSNLIIPTEEIPPRILPDECRDPDHKGSHGSGTGPFFSRTLTPPARSFGNGSVIEDRCIFPILYVILKITGYASRLMVFNRCYSIGFTR